MQTLDNMFARGIIPDAITYIEGIPDQYIRGKGKIWTSCGTRWLPPAGLRKLQWRR